MRRVGERRIVAVLAARWARQLDVLAGDVDRARIEGEFMGWHIVGRMADGVWRDVCEAVVGLAVEAADAAHAANMAANVAAGAADGVVGGAGFADLARAWADDARAAAGRVADLRAPCDQSLAVDEATVGSAYDGDRVDADDGTQVVEHVEGHLSAAFQVQVEAGSGHVGVTGQPCDRQVSGGGLGFELGHDG
jgi:hypothetical protein